MRKKTDKELLKELDDLKKEYAALRVSKATGTGAAKLSKITIIKKSMHTMMT